MQKKINLIPTEMAVPASAVKLAKVLNKISIVAVILLIITSLSVAGLFFYFSSEVQKQDARIASMKSRITSLSQNEQKLVLAKDRLSKISVVQKIKSVGDEVSRFKSFSEIANNSGSIITEANLTPRGTEVTLLSQTSDSLSPVLKPLATIAGYKTVVLDSLGYSSGSGFISTISLEIE
jgi:cell division protein FtsL